MRKFWIPVCTVLLCVSLCLSMSGLSCIALLSCIRPRPVFHYIAFPDQELMSEIVRVHFPRLDEHLLSQVLSAFYKIRALPQIKKKPSTSEIIDWIQALIHGGVNPDRIVKEVPYLGVLLKKNEDMDALRRNWR